MKQTNKTVLIKRSIEKDGLPKNEGDYLCYLKIKPLKIISYFDGKKFIHTYSSEIIEYYEEVELSKLIEEMMPAKKKTSSLEKS